MATLPSDAVRQTNPIEQKSDAAAELASIALQLERCDALELQARGTPMSPRWDDIDQFTYLKHLDDCRQVLYARRREIQGGVSQ